MTKRPLRSQTTAGINRMRSSGGSMTIESYLKRAQEFSKRQDYSGAILEIRQAIKKYPGSALCHSTLSVLYLETNQAKMAGVHAKRALVLEPTNQLALQIQQKLTKQQPKSIKRQPVPVTSKKNGIMGLFTKKMF